MEFIAVTARIRLKRAFYSLVALTILFSTVLSTILPAAAADKLSGQDAVTVGELEQRLFFVKYADQDGEERVARIEKQVYGEAVQAPFPDRIARLRQMLDEKKAQESAQQEEQQRQQQAVQQKQQQQKQQVMQQQQQQNDFDRARENIIQAREQEIGQLLSEGVELWRQKRAQEATQRFEQVLRLDPANAEAHFSLGIIEESTGNFVEALSSYQQASQAQPQVKEYGEAVKTLEKKLQQKQLAQGQQAALRMLAEAASAAFKQGEYVKALDLYKQLDSKAPNQALVKYNIGTLYLMVKDSQSALKYYEQAVKLNPSEQRYVKAYSELKQQVDLLNERIAENNRQSEQLKNPGKAPKPKKDKNGNFKQMSPDQIPSFPGMKNNGRASFGGNSLPQATQAAPQSPVFGGYLNTPLADVMSKYGLVGKGSNEGVRVTTVGIASRASAAGIQPGDHIRAVDGNEVYDPKQVNDILSRKGFNQPVQMMIMRNGNLAVINL